MPNQKFTAIIRQHKAMTIIDSEHNFHKMFGSFDGKFGLAKNVSTDFALIKTTLQYTQLTF